MRKKVLILVVLLIAAITLAVYFAWPSDQQESSNTTNETENNQTETEDETAEEEQTDEAEENSSISSHVREAVMGALQLFKKDAHIVAIGDSLTQGVGDEEENGGYVGVLKEQLDNQSINASIDNFGKRGNRTDHLLKRLEQEEIQDSLKKADTVLITIGANDIMKIMKDNFVNLTEEPFIEGREPYGERLTAIFDKITSLQPDAKIYLIGFFNPFEQYFGEIEALNQIITRWNNKSLEVTNQFEQVQYIPMQDVFQNEAENVYADDNFHPNHRGYQLIAERVITYLQNDLRQAEE
ncbi:SGNH/GDSL hydrolase family protein [Gracilibacillus caseinilyticus]|uniref:SGNH/GDSL hydrolase family protein n=1 Tax=Gracilibacillus caseinilyticus TaxID=2932256 RepID=A0ABY4F287_9BACI|nr:SGNH/GDSL hydrolase family protein [Gracilibacillus caseinilyticus]UOQ50177.1 SGNH/GDSL hydrolase family protein [Gracilibacillus caseinilyticus]